MRRLVLAASTALVGLALTATPTVAMPAPRAEPATSLAAPRAVTTATYAPPIPGATRWRVPSGVRQVVVVSARTWTTTYATVTLWTRVSTGWRRSATWPARVGWSGMVVGAKRVQDSGKTPAGFYRMTETFGRLSNPGTRMRYTRVTLDHWWVEDRRSAYYNQMRRGSQGGFALRTSGYNSSERLATMGSQYDYVSVIDFNRPDPVIGRGAGIFLHAFGSGATAGCVSIRHDHMATVLKWLDPAASPRIMIGEDSYLAP